MIGDLLASKVGFHSVRHIEVEKRGFLGIYYSLSMGARTDSPYGVLICTSICSRNAPIIQVFP